MGGKRRYEKKEKKVKWEEGRKNELQILVGGKMFAHLGQVRAPPRRIESLVKR